MDEKRLKAKMLAIRKIEMEREAGIVTELEQHLTYEEAAKFLGIKKTTLYSLVCQKRIPHVRLSSRMVRFPKKMLEDWLESRIVQPEEESLGPRWEV